MDLADVLAAAAAGSPPAADGGVTVVPRGPGGAVAGVVGFTAHHVVTADVAPDWVRAVLPPGSLSAPMSARFLAALADQVGAEPGAYDTVLVAPPPGVPLAGLVPVVAAESARLRRAERYRVDVRAWTVPGAILVVGRSVVPVRDRNGLVVLDRVPGRPDLGPPVLALS